MVSKSYIPNHALHKHYYGQGMARFKGSRMQYGKGLGSIFKRVALPLLSKGAKIAAPHVLKESVTSQKTNQLFFKDTPSRLNWTNLILTNTTNAIPGWTRKDGDGSVIPADANNMGTTGYTRDTFTQRRVL